MHQKFEANDSGAHYALIFIQDELEKHNILSSEKNKALLLAGLAYTCSPSARNLICRRKSGRKIS